MSVDDNFSKIIKTERSVHNRIVYKYELRSFESKNVASFGIVLYEICVEMKIKDSVTFYRTGGIFSDIERALMFFDMIRKNLATPYDLPYIIEDCFSF